MAGLLNIGLTGLNAAQLQLNTTSHNIVNAGTPGFTRQTVALSTNTPQFSGSGFFGQGVQVANVTRQYSQFLENQVLSADNKRAEYATYSAQIAQINDLLADPQAGLSPALQQFFAGVQEVAANPNSVPARQAMISSAQALVTRFQSLDTRLAEVRAGTEGEIEYTVNSINSLAAQIADLNKRIVLAQAGGSGYQPNDLLDQRNAAVAELNKLVKTSTVVDKDGQMSVFIGSGQSLVRGGSYSRLGTELDPSDPTRNRVTMLAPNGNQVPLPENLLNGGALGGLLAFRREALDPAQDRLNLIARQLTEIFNEQHRLGVDLDGVLGGDFFRSSMVRRESGTSDAPTVRIGNDTLLTNDQYRLTYDDAAGSYTLTRLSDNSVIADPADVGLVISTPATTTAGDSFIIEPLRGAARNLAVAINDPAKIAAGSPVSVELPLSNAGNATVKNIRVTSVDGMSGAYPQFPAFTVEYSGGALTLNPPATGTITPATYDPTTESAGKEFTISFGGSEFSFTMSGAPADGDVLSFAPTELGVADNRNAVALGALQTGKSMLTSSSGESTATFQSAYSQLVSQIGNRAREAQVGEKAQESLLTQATNARESLSGVNLDEEAANLIRFQQAYQASGRVMAVAQRLFDELISISR